MDSKQLGSGSHKGSNGGHSNGPFGIIDIIKDSIWEPELVTSIPPVLNEHTNDATPMQRDPPSRAIQEMPIFMTLSSIAEVAPLLLSNTDGLINTFCLALSVIFIVLSS